MVFSPGVPLLAHRANTAPASSYHLDGHTGVTPSHQTPLAPPEEPNSVTSSPRSSTHSGITQPLRLPPALNHHGLAERSASPAPRAYSDSEYSDDETLMSPVKIRNQLLSAVQRGVVVEAIQRDEEDHILAGDARGRRRTNHVVPGRGTLAAARRTAQLHHERAVGRAARVHRGLQAPVMGHDECGRSVFYDSSASEYSDDGDGDDEDSEINMLDLPAEYTGDGTGAGNDETDRRGATNEACASDADGEVDDPSAVNEPASLDAPIIDDATATERIGSNCSTDKQAATSRTCERSARSTARQGNIYALSVPEATVKSPATGSLGSPPPPYESFVPAPAYEPGEEFGCVKRPMSVYEPRGTEPAAGPQTSNRAVHPEMVFNALAMEVGTSEAAAGGRKREATGSISRLGNSIRRAWRRSTIA